MYSFLVSSPLRFVLGKNMIHIFLIFTDPDPSTIPHDAYMRVENKDGLVINKPRIITRQQQPTFHTCTLSMDYKLQASGAGKDFVQNCYVD